MRKYSDVDTTTNHHHRRHEPMTGPDYDTRDTEGHDTDVWPPVCDYHADDTTDANDDCAACAIEREAAYADMAHDLLAIDPNVATANDALAIVRRQVALVGWPAAGAGMVADQEWNTEQGEVLANHTCYEPHGVGAPACGACLMEPADLTPATRIAFHLPSIRAASLRDDPPGAVATVGTPVGAWTPPAPAEDDNAGWITEHRDTNGGHYGLNGPNTSASLHCPLCRRPVDGTPVDLVDTFRMAVIRLERATVRRERAFTFASGLGDREPADRELNDAAADVDAIASDLRAAVAYQSRFAGHLDTRNR